MLLQVLAQICLATRLRQRLAQHSISPRAQVLVVCLEAQQQTHQEVYLVEQLQAVSLDSNQLLNVSVAFLQILTLSIQILIQGNPNVVLRNCDKCVCYKQGFLYQELFWKCSNVICSCQCTYCTCTYIATYM